MPAARACCTIGASADGLACDCAARSKPGTAGADSAGLLPPLLRLPPSLSVGGGETVSYMKGDT